MTVETQSNLVSYLGDDIAVTFPFTFPVYVEDHLQVYLQDIVTYALVLLSSSNYSVTGIGDEDGGSVITNDPVATGIRIIIARTLPLQQDLDVLNQGGFYPQNVEKEFDFLEMQIQQLNEEVNRTVRGQLAEAWPELPAPPTRRGRLLGFEDDETAYPVIADQEFLTSLIAEILQAGFGIELIVTSTTITIVNTAPGTGEVAQDAWLLEDATTGGGGGPGAGDSEFIRDIIGATLVGLGLDITVDDTENTITIDATGETTAEVIRDHIGATLVAGTGITITVDDPGDTITIEATGGVDGFQPLDATLTGIAATNPTTNQFLYATGTNTFDVATVTPAARTLLDDTTTAAMLATLGAVAGGVGTFSNNTLSLEIPLATGGTLLVQGGTGTQGADSNGTVTFPTAYGTFAPVVLVSGGLSDHTQEGDAHLIGNPSTTGFTVGNSAGGGTVTYNWIAFGRKL